MSKDESEDCIRSIEVNSESFLRDLRVNEDAPDTLYILPPDWQARLVTALMNDDQAALRQLARESAVVENVG